MLSSLILRYSPLSVFLLLGAVVEEGGGVKGVDGDLLLDLLDDGDPLLDDLLDDGDLLLDDLLGDAERLLEDLLLI